MSGQTVLNPEVVEPTDPGFYKYSGGNNVLIFLLTYQGEWMVVNDFGTMEHCDWEYIAQALHAWDLVKIA